MHAALPRSLSKISTATLVAVFVLGSTFVSAQGPVDRRSYTLTIPRSVDRPTRQASYKVDYSIPLFPQTPRLALQPSPTNDAPSSDADAAESKPLKVEEIAKPTAPESRLTSPLLGHKSIGELTVNINLPATDEEDLEVPENLAAEFFARQATHFEQPDFVLPTQHIVGLRANTTGTMRMPVYFEEENFERHGTSHGIVQPAVSGAHFFKNVVALPYKMVVEPPRQTRHYDYPYEAGRVAPHYYRPYPLRVDASVAEIALIIGLIAIIP